MFATTYARETPTARVGPSMGERRPDLRTTALAEADRIASAFGRFRSSSIRPTDVAILSTNNIEYLLPVNFGA